MGVVEKDTGDTSRREMPRSEMRIGEHKEDSVQLATGESIGGRLSTLGISGACKAAFSPKKTQLKPTACLRVS